MNANPAATADSKAAELMIRLALSVEEERAHAARLGKAAAARRVASRPDREASEHAAPLECDPSYWFG